MTLEEVAEYLRVNKKTIYRLLEKHEIPSTKVGHQYRFDKNAVDEWLRAHSSGAKANILVVDDDPDVCSFIKDTLEEAGHRWRQRPIPGRDWNWQKKRILTWFFLTC